MPELGMQKPVRQAAVHAQPDADPGTDSDVGEIGETARGPPAALREGSAVHVGVETQRNIERTEARSERRLAPAGFRRRRDPAVAGRVPIEIDWAERGDAERADRAVRRNAAAKL